VFPSNIGTPHYPDAIRVLFKKTLVLAEIDPSRYRLYDLRHTCATLLLRGNIHPKVVSERLGHSSITITLDVYSHSVPSMQETATENIGNMIYGATETPDKHPPASAVELDLTDEAMF
jgi:integrase